MAAVRTGLDALLEHHLDLLRDRRVGLLINPSSVDRCAVPSLLRLRDAGITPAALFGPEHGLWGAEQDMIAVGGERDPLTGLAVHSLYGATIDTLRPRASDVAGLDVLVFDIQDVGSRYYTYVYTLMLAMEACAEAGVQVVVLDRPNPLGGLAVEGGTVQPGYTSFVGLHPLAVRHGMTAAELARLFAAERQIDVELIPLWMQGWTRAMHFDQTGLPWVQPSPNMPTVDTAFVYPGLCLLEGTTWSEGRGTTRPFETFGAPGVDPFALASALSEELGPSANARPLYFRPTFQKHAGHVCGGAALHVLDRRSFHALGAGIAALVAARRAAPHTLAWREQAYEFVQDRLAIDLLFGGAKPRALLEAGARTRDVLDLLEPECTAFCERRQPYLHYS